ncbi:MAG: hypothetical protein R6X16_12300 [Anaerolineae bacterium]
MEDRLQNVRNWAKQGNLKQFQAELEMRLAPLGYCAEMDMDRIRCYRVTVEKGLMGIRRREVKQAVGVIRRQNGSIELMDADEAFVEALTSVAPAT